MAKLRTVFRCAGCGSEAPQWAGRCSSCGGWNTLAAEAQPLVRPPISGSRPGEGSRPVQLAHIDPGAWAATPTGIGELDRVLGGGLVPGSVTLMGGEPGIGKSTLLLQMAAAQAGAGATVLYASAEESSQQVRARAERLGVIDAGVWLVAEVALPPLLAHFDELAPDVVVVDSIQSVSDPELGSAPGSVTQVRECAHRLVQEAKSRGIAVVLVGHVTKDGTLAGPRVLEHVVDTVLAFEGDRLQALRLLRATKHRFGATHELGLFEMAESGLVGVPDASGVFLADRQAGIPGSVVVPAMEGQRPLLVELQALVARTNLPNPRRSGQGLDSGRLAMLAAVLQERVKLDLLAFEIYALAVGGVRIVEPAADLAVVLAVASAHFDKPVPADLVACGEVGLGGELRHVVQLSRRLSEAARLGFTRAVVPHSVDHAPPGMELIRVATAAAAIDRLDLRGGAGS